MNRELQAILLTENESKLSRINDFLENDYKRTLRQMFVVLLDAIKNKTLNDIYTILSNIETIVLSQDVKNFKTINEAVCEANSKMQEVKNYVDARDFRNIKFSLIDINRKMSEKKEKSDNHSLYNFYHYLVFEEKNLDMVELLLNNEKNVLNRKDEFNNNLLYNVIDYYCSLHEDEKEEIEYYYEVIISILKCEEDKLIKNDNDIYFGFIK